MNNTKRSSNSGCFSAVLHRLLCSGSPQTHPSDHSVESNTNEFVGDEARVHVQASESGPGIVARLMGLDSLPESNWIHKGETPGPVMRSRSVNFMDYMLEFDITQAKHRRVKTSASFREVPQGPQLLQRNHNHEFLVVYLDSVDKNKEAAGLKPLKSEKGDGSSSKHAKQKENVREKVACRKENQEKNKKISKLKNEPRRVSGKNPLKAGSCINGAKDVQINRGANSKTKRPLKLVNQKEASVLTRKKKNSDGLSLVSVLDVNDSTARQEDRISEDSRSLELKKSERKCSSKSVKHDSHTVDISARISIPEGLEKQELSKKHFESTDIEEIEYYMELVGKPCKLTDEDIKFSNWMKTKNVFTFEDFEEICFEFGEQILDLMLHQLADELVEISCERRSPTLITGTFVSAKQIAVGI